MTRKRKRLGMFAVALMVLSALAAQTAVAHEPARFTFEQDATTVTGEQVGNVVARITGREVTCTTEEFQGLVETPEDDTSATAITLTPTYTGCTVFGFANAKVTGFGHFGESETCDYLLNADGTLDLVCPPGRDVTVEIGTTCIMHYPAQTDLGSITYTTENRSAGGHVKHDLRAHVNLDSVTVTHTDLNFLCPLSGSGDISNAELEGTWTLWAEDPETGTPTGITQDATKETHLPAKFTSEQSSTTVLGEGESGNAFSITGQKVECGSEEFHGTAAGTSFEEITITPTYTECEAFGFGGALITGFGHFGGTENCDYVVKASGKVDLACPAGVEVVIEVGEICTVHIPAQKDIGTVTYTTGVRESKHDLTMDLNLSGITVTHTDKSGSCPFSGSGEISNATLKGSWTLWGQDPESKKAVGITWDATVN